MLPGTGATKSGCKVTTN